MVVIREFVNEDAPRCETIIKECLYKSFLDFPLKMHLSKLLSASIADTSYPLFVACDKGEVLGVAGLNANHYESELKRFYVHPSHQGKGVGRTLYHALEDKVRSAGIRGISAEAIGKSYLFYEKMGFLHNGMMKREWCDGLTCYILPVTRLVKRIS